MSKGTLFSEWVSLRNRWPDVEGEYKVMDVNSTCAGTALYNGYDFTCININKGDANRFSGQITHWKYPSCKEDLEGHSCSFDDYKCFKHPDDKDPFFRFTLPDKSGICVEYCPFCGEKA